MSSAIEIGQKIITQRVVEKKDQEQTAPTPAQVSVSANDQPPIKMNETIDRPEFLMGATYKIKTPMSEHAMYITINDIILNEDTDHEVRQPYEIFISSKAMDNFQWTVALTRVISAVFRKGGDISFLVDELLSVYDPSGGYFKKGGVFMPSLVAEIGSVIRRHLQVIGMIDQPEMDEHQKKLVAEKKAQYEASKTAKNKMNDRAEENDNQFPASASMCNKCNTKAVIVMDGCATCLSCADSKCG